MISNKALSSILSNTLSVLMLVSLISLLNACGFALRGTNLGDSLQLSQIDLQCDSKRQFYFCNQLKQGLAAQSVKLDPEANITLKITKLRDAQRTFTLDQDASAAEFELKRGIRYQLILKHSDNSEQELLQQNELFNSQVYRDSDITKIAKDREQATIQQALDDELVSRLIRELSALQLDSSRYQTKRL